MYPGDLWIIGLMLVVLYFAYNMWTH